MCSQNQQIIKQAALLLPCLLLLSCNAIQKKSSDTNSERAPIAVKTIILSGENSFTTNTYIGLARASKATILSTHNSGTLVKLNVSQGDKVKKGQLIAKINSPNVNSAHSIAHASLDQAEDGYKRAKAVYDSGSISEVKMVEIKTQLEQAKASAAAADNALENCSIKAPYDAYIEEVMLDEGQAVDALQAVVRIINLNRMQISFSVPENEIINISEGQKLIVDVPASGLTGLEASIISKGVSASALSHSYNCIAELDQKVGELLPGMVCKLNLIDQSESVIIVPSAAIMTDIDGRYLWVVEDGKAQKRMVEIDGFASKGIRISKGLSEGDEIIVEGFQKVSSGMKVVAEN